MASTTLTGDRRWTTTRKSSMTVLGKVPKPINLPSQRLENHGLDPNVEIVPKGTLTWGSRPSAVPNAWGSSALLSPNTDGSSGSTSHVNARPSSGGSGTRPSTAGSDRSHELASSAWGPNSRPSSASGLLTSTQTSTLVNRPRSAETRPSSSQLSRFAEASVESTVTWGPARTAERGGAALLKASEFTLTSGDFPSLGSDKTSEQQMQRGHSSHGRPGSSGATVTQKEAPNPLSGDRNADSYSGHVNMNSWKTDCYPYDSIGSRNVNCDLQQAQAYPSANVPQHQFGPWHNVPVSSPDGVWYRGGTVNAPFRPAGPPGSYPIESYASYPQFPARQPIPEPHPRPGPDPDGYCPKNVEAYPHHQPPGSYMIPNYPVLPVRHGFDQNTVNYEGYYGPPHGNFCNSSEHEVSVMGMSDHPGSYKQHAKQSSNLNPGILDVRPGVHASVMAKEQNECEHAHESRPVQYKLLLKQHDELEDKSDIQEKQGQSIIASSPHRDKGIPPGSIIPEELHWRRNNRNDEGKVVTKLVPGQESLSNHIHHSTVLEGHSTYPAVKITSGNSGKGADVSLLKKPNTSTYMDQNLEQNSVMKKNMPLIEKIESLNNKARSADGRSEMEEKRKHLKVVNLADNSTKVISTNALSNECAPTSGVVISVSDSIGNRNKKSFISEKISSGLSDSLAFPSGKLDSFVVDEKVQSQAHKREYAMQGRVDDRSKLRSNSKEAGDCIKKPPASDILVVSTITNGDNDNSERLLGFHGAVKVHEEFHHTTNTSGAPHATSTSDPLDHNAQRARLKEIAMRRAKELQKEEEERTRDQKAKALAKLEELNRRTLAQSTQHKNVDVPLVNDIQHNQEEGEGTNGQSMKDIGKLEEPNGPNSAHCLNQKNPDVSPSNSVNHKQVSGASTAVKIDAIIIEAPCPISHKQVSGASTAVKIDAIIIEAPGPISAENSNLMVLADDSRMKIPAVSSDCSVGISSQPQISVTKDSASWQNTSSLFGQDKVIADVVNRLTSSDLHDTNVIQRKQMGPRRQSIISKEENPNEKQIAAEIVIQKNLGEGAVLKLTDKLPASEETSVHHKKKNNRNTRSKNKLDETLKSSFIPTSAPAKGNVERGSTAIGDDQQLTHVVEATHNPAQNSSQTILNQNSIPFSNQRQSQATEKLHNRTDRDGKPHSSKKSTRNQQVIRNQLVIRPVDKFHGSEAVVWAPVRSSNRHEQSEAGQNTSETCEHTPEKNGHGMKNSAKTKRAEVERYVPKPIAKESSQQDNSQDPSPPLNLEASGCMTRKPDSESQDLESGSIDGSALGKPKPVSDIKNVDNKPNRRGKMRTSWRQRVTADSPSASSCSSVGGVCDPAKPMIEPSGHDKPSKSVNSPEEHFQYDGWSNNNDNVMRIEPVALPAVIRDQGIQSKQQYKQYAVHKVEVTNYAPRDKNLQSCPSDKNNIQCPVLDLNESNQRNISRTKYPVTGSEHTKSHWKPKYQVYSHYFQHENSRGQEATPEGIIFGKEILSQEVNYYSLNNENSAPETRASSAARRNERLQEANMVVDGSSEQAYSSNQDLLTTVEAAHSSIGTKHDQHSDSSAPRRQGHNNSHSSRGQAVAYRGWDLGQDPGRPIPHMDGDRRKGNSYFEYQRTQFSSKVGDSQQNFVRGDEAQESPQVSESKYKVRGRNHSTRGGHFYAQRSKIIQTGNSMNSEAEIV